MTFEIRALGWADRVEVGEDFIWSLEMLLIFNCNELYERLVFEVWQSKRKDLRKGALSDRSCFDDLNKKASSMSWPFYKP